jgi:hypothetical protein
VVDSDDAVAELRGLALERACGHVGADRLIAAGLSALLAGVDSPSLRLLAGLGRREEPEASDLFVRVVEELDLASELPASRDQALWALARWWSELIVSGKLDPLTGADLILWRVDAELGHPEPLQAITQGAYAASDWDENWTIPLEQIAREIVQAARDFLRGTATA